MTEQVVQTKLAEVVSGEMVFTEEHTAIFKALIQARGKIKLPKADRFGYEKYGKPGQPGNPFASMTAINIAINKPLFDNGLMMMASKNVVVDDDDRATITIETRILHESGQYLYHTLTVPYMPTTAPSKYAKNTDLPLKDGAMPNDHVSQVCTHTLQGIVTYFIRQSIIEMLGLPTQLDDDMASEARREDQQTYAPPPAQYAQTYAPPPTQHVAIPAPIMDDGKIEEVVLKQRVQSIERAKESLSFLSDVKVSEIVEVYAKDGFENLDDVGLTRLVQAIHIELIRDFTDLLGKLSVQESDNLLDKCHIKRSEINEMDSTRLCLGIVYLKNQSDPDPDPDPAEPVIVQVVQSDVAPVLIQEYEVIGNAKVHPLNYYDRMQAKSGSCRSTPFARHSIPAAKLSKGMWQEVDEHGMPVSKEDRLKKDIQSFLKVLSEYPQLMVELEFDERFGNHTTREVFESLKECYKKRIMQVEDNIDSDKEVTDEEIADFLTLVSSFNDKTVERIGGVHPSLMDVQPHISYYEFQHMNEWFYEIITGKKIRGGTVKVVPESEKVVVSESEKVKVVPESETDIKRVRAKIINKGVTEEFICKQVLKPMGLCSKGTVLSSSEHLEAALKFLENDESWYFILKQWRKPITKEQVSLINEKLRELNVNVQKTIVRRKIATEVNARFGTSIFELSKLPYHLFSQVFEALENIVIGLHVSEGMN